MDLSKSKFSPELRKKNIAEMQTQVFDLVVIGGGITGAGVARDAASRGMKVCVVEKNDFASGTSSRSSKLIHGGIRYLENLEFHLVFEALSERHILFQIAPHLVHPLRFVLPLYKGGRVGMFKMGLGMWLYDALALFHAPKQHERLTADQTLERLPVLQLNDLMGSYVYSDAYMDDDRLVLETLRSAASMGALAANYCRAVDVKKDSAGQITALNVVDETTGNSFSIKGKHFVSSLGPWTDQVLEGFFNWKPILRTTKGVHLTFSRQRLPLTDAVVMAAERRIVFGIPRNDMVIVGTTDTDFSGDPAQVHTTSDDVEYLLKVVERYFPQAKIKKEDIIASYAGVRPLVDDGNSSESKTSREHVILSTPYNLTAVAGGKYTTYRLMAEQIVDKTLESMEISQRVRFLKNDTQKPINPKITAQSFSDSMGWISQLSQEFGFSEEQALTLLQRHGPEARTVIENGKKANLADPWEMEALFAIENTMCLSLRDFMLRRSPLFLAKGDHGKQQLEAIAGVFQKYFSWDRKRVDEEVQKYWDHREFELGWKTRNHG